MDWTTKLLVIAGRTIESQEVDDAILDRAAAGPVRVTLPRRVERLTAARLTHIAAGAPPSSAAPTGG